MPESAASEQFTAEFATSLASISPAVWNNLTGVDYPFLRHEFLYGLEKTGCTNAETGWQPCHLLLKLGEEIQAVMPLYLKSHSYGEYVFDWSWADAWASRGLHYYPKLLTAVPFTPAGGPRIGTRDGLSEAAAAPLVLDAVRHFASERDLSSWHLLFPAESVSAALQAQGMHQREAVQFHWFNEGYSSFADFLAGFSSRKRKSLKRERRRIAEQGLVMTTRTGSDITEEDWTQFYRFYQLTYARRSGHGGYLSREFFLETAAGMGDQVVMVLAHHGSTPVAGALCFRSSDTLYGRYWGCEHDFDCLHFEACYYQGIDYCIANGLSRFDPGAQGEHKIQRGFRPTTTLSNHWIADPALSAAVADFTRREAQHVAQYKEDGARLLPFK